VVEKKVLRELLRLANVRLGFQQFGQHLVYRGRKPCKVLTLISWYIFPIVLCNLPTFSRLVRCLEFWRTTCWLCLHSRHRGSFELSSGRPIGFAGRSNSWGIRSQAVQPIDVSSINGRNHSNPHSENIVVFCDSSGCCPSTLVRL
jgi:hypothetical protein